MCNPYQHDQQQYGRHEDTSPDPVLDCSRVIFTTHDSDCKLPERPNVNIQKQPRHPADRRPEHVRAKSNPCQAVKIIEQARRKTRVQLTQQDNFPALTFNSTIQGAQRWVTQESLLKPSSGYRPT